MIKHIPLAELQELLHSLQLPPETRLTVKFDDALAVQKVLKRQKALAAMQKLKGSGNGKLVDALLFEREKARFSSSPASI